MNQVLSCWDNSSFSRVLDSMMPDKSLNNFIKLGRDCTEWNWSFPQQR